VHQHLHDAPPAMAIPLIVLALGSILAGYVGVPAVIGGANRLETFLAPSFQAAGVQAEAAAEPASPAEGSVELMLMGLASLVSLAGIGFAARTYLRHPDRAARLAARFPGAYRFLLNKGYVDELYNDALVQPIKALSQGALWHGLDATVIDGAVNGAGLLVTGSGGAVRKVQTGSVRAYAVSVMLGAVLALGYYLWR
jgi:NADH-quinone oxidoreductase subunit L